MKTENLNIKYLGTTYGGWVVDLNSINDGDTIIDGGIGEDISFDQELLAEKKVNIIGVDPTPKSHKFLKNQNIDIILIPKAIEKKGTNEVTMYQNTNPNHVSESIDTGHGSVGNNSYQVAAVSITELIETYQPSLIKLDIEGSEYNVYQECVGVKQICLEFHHHCIEGKNFLDTMKVVNFFREHGYTVIDNRHNYQEVTLLKNN